MRISRAVIQWNDKAAGVARWHVAFFPAEENVVSKYFCAMMRTDDMLRFLNHTNPDDVVVNGVPNEMKDLTEGTL